MPNYLDFDDDRFIYRNWCVCAKFFPRLCDRQLQSNLRSCFFILQNAVWIVVHVHDPWQCASISVSAPSLCVCVADNNNVIFDIFHTWANIFLSCLCIDMYVRVLWPSRSSCWAWLWLWLTLPYTHSWTHIRPSAQTHKHIHIPINICTIHRHRQKYTCILMNWINFTVYLPKNCSVYAIHSRNVNMRDCFYIYEFICVLADES